MSGVSEYCSVKVFGDIGDTKLGNDAAICGLELVVGTIVGVVLRLLVVLVMAKLDGVVCSDIL